MLTGLIQQQNTADIRTNITKSEKNIRSCLQQEPN